jgi:hypothetical protein
MLLTTSTAGTIVHSLPLTKFMVTGHYQVCPGIFKKNISTQQSSWMKMEDGGSAAVALEGFGCAAALGSGIGWWFKIAAVELGGSSSRRTCNNGLGISVVKAKGLLSRCWHQHWQGQREGTCPMQGTYVGSNGYKIGILQWQWQWQQCGYNNGTNKARARGLWRRTSTGKARAMQQWCHNRSDKGEGKRLSNGAHQLSTQVGRKGYNGRAGLK